MTYRLFPSTNGPASPASYSGPFLAGVLAEVTTGGMWLDGYFWWVCPTGQSTTPQKFALWQVFSAGVGAHIAAADALSGTLTPGQWNFVPCTAPVPLSIGACYDVCTGWSTVGTTGFPDTSNSFGSGDPFAAGIVNGPLSAFSDQSGTLPAPFTMPQGVFSTAGADPTAAMPSTGSASGNFWMDLLVDTVPPVGASYRLWPNMPHPPGSLLTGIFTLATEFTLSQPCLLNDIWFYSPAGAVTLPSRTGIWNVATQAEFAPASNLAPSWSGAAGSGYVSCSYSGVTIPAGTWKAAVFISDTVTNCFTVLTHYWDTGAGQNGITTGPLSAPDNGAASPGQASFNSGTWAYPNSTAAAENYFLDIQVTPAPPVSGLVTPDIGDRSSYKKQLIWA